MTITDGGRGRGSSSGAGHGSAGGAGSAGQGRADGSGLSGSGRTDVQDRPSTLEDQLGLGIVESVLHTLGLPGEVVERLVCVAEIARAGQDDSLDRLEDSHLLGALEVSHALHGQLDATAVDLTRALTRRSSERLLRDREATSPEELTARQRRDWRRQSKMAVSAELRALLGLGVQESYDMVALATSPEAVRAPVVEGMQSRGARWAQARTFWDEAGDLPHEDAADVARAIFGDDPDEVVPERLVGVEGEADEAQDGEAETSGGEAETSDGEAETSDGEAEAGGAESEDGDAEADGAAPENGGDPEAAADGARSEDGGDVEAEAGGPQVSSSPWPVREFRRVLRREVEARRADTGDEAPHRRARKKAHVSVSIGADGMSSITFAGETVQVMGMAQRVELIARRLKSEGAEGTLPTLRFQAGSTLLQHTIVAPLPDGRGQANAPGSEGLFGPDELMSPENLDHMAKVVTGQPGVELQVITPLDALIGHDALDFLRGRLSGPADPDCQCREQAAGVQTSPDAEPRHPDGEPPEQSPEQSPESGPRPIGEVLGQESAFLTAEHLRELLLRPGSVLRRLVTHPGSGRLLHRESKGYRPDAGLKAFVRARDLMCKGPGCTHPAFYSDLDHVIPYPEGPTSETNLNLDCRLEHLIKTYELWTCVLSATGWVTWTSFFGRFYTTRPHDYRQYSPGLRDPGGAHAQSRTQAETPPQTRTQAPAQAATPPQTRTQAPAQAETPPQTPTPAQSEPQGGGPAPPSIADLLLSGSFFTGMDRDEAGHLAGKLIYAALAHRPPRARLRADDDGPWDSTVPEDPQAWLATVPLRLRHRTSGGHWRNGPPPNQPTAEQVLQAEGLVPDDLSPGPEPGPGHDEGTGTGSSGEDRDPWQDVPPF